MKSVQRLLALGLFVCGVCILGCGTETTTPPADNPPAETGSGSDGSGTSTDTDDSGTTEGSATSATTPDSSGGGEMQMVSLNVPNMT